MKLQKKEGKKLSNNRIVKMKKNGAPIPLVLLEISREYKSIYSLTKCCGLVMEAEPLRTRTDIVQCHRFQLFGHMQRNCHIQHKCMKCGEQYSTHECQKLKTTMCANCKMNLNNPSNRTERNQKSPSKSNPWKRIEKAKNDKNTNVELHQNLEAVLANFLETNAIEGKQRAFLACTKKIVELFQEQRTN